MELLDTKPIRDSKGNKLTDPQLIKHSLQAIEKHIETTKTAIPINYQFIQWLHGAKEAIDTRPAHMTEAGALQEYKNKTIQQHLDFDLIARNTIKAQAKDEKKGLYNAKVIKQVKGVYK